MTGSSLRHEKPDAAKAGFHLFYDDLWDSVVNGCWLYMRRNERPFNLQSTSPYVRLMMSLKLAIRVRHERRADLEHTWVCDFDVEVEMKLYKPTEVSRSTYTPTPQRLPEPFGIECSQHLLRVLLVCHYSIWIFENYLFTTFIAEGRSASIGCQNLPEPKTKVLKMQSGGSIKIKWQRERGRNDTNHHPLSRLYRTSVQSRSTKCRLSSPATKEDVRWEEGSIVGVEACRISTWVIREN